MGHLILSLTWGAVYKYCLFLIVIYYLTGGNNSMSRFCKFGKLHVTKGNVDKLLGILLTASKELKRSGPH